MSVWGPSFGGRVSFHRVHSGGESEATGVEWDDQGPAHVGHTQNSHSPNRTRKLTLESRFIATFGFTRLRIWN